YGVLVIGEAVGAPGPLGGRVRRDAGVVHVHQRVLGAVLHELDVSVHPQHVRAARHVVEPADAVVAAGPVDGRVVGLVLGPGVPHDRDGALGFRPGGRVVDVGDEEAFDPFLYAEEGGRRHGAVVAGVALAARLVVVVAQRLAV